MKPRRLEGQREWAALFLLFGLLFIRCCCYGLRYFPQLDDYIQLHNYTAYHPDIWPFMQRLGLLAARPAAGVLDICFWGRLWPALILGVALIAGLYAASAVLFRRVWRKYFPVGWLLGRLERRRTVAAALCGVLSLAFCVAALSEIHDYKATWEDDQAVMSAILAGTDNGAALPGEGENLILGVEPSYLAEQNFAWHEHIHGVTESRWALTGGLQCVSGREDFPYVTPLPASAGAEILGGMEYGSLWLYDPDSRTVQEVTARRTADSGYDLLAGDGAPAGRVTEEGLIRSRK